MQPDFKLVLSLNEIRRNIARLKAELKELLYIQSFMERTQGASTSPAPPTGGESIEGVDAGDSRKSKAQGAIAVLRAAGPGKPMKTGEIAEELVLTQGFPHAPGRNLERKVFNVLTRRADVFRKVAPGLWTLHEFSPNPTSTTAGAPGVNGQGVSEQRLFEGQAGE